MTDEQKAAFINAQAICARIELESMLQANREREANGLAPAYSEDAFMALQEKYVISHNGVFNVIQNW